MRIGYARVSTTDQTAAGQVSALNEAGCEKIFSETASGADRGRPVLEATLEFMREGDVLVVWKLDRLARSLAHLMELSERLAARGIGLVSLTEVLDTTTPGGRLVFHVFAAISEFERGLIQERSAAGRARARAQGVRMGRPRVALDVGRLAELARDERLSRKDLSRMFGVSEVTIYRRLRAMEEAAGRAP